MNTKQKRQRPRLDRRNAIKNIDYDASLSSTPSSSSSSFDDHPTLRTRSLDLYPVSDPGSFRIEGLDGEFDRICRSLGLSGPEDFAIPAAAWEARKLRSPSDHFPTSRFKDHYNSPRESADLSDSLGARVRGCDEVEQRDKCYELKSEFDSAKTETFLESFGARVRVSDEVKHGDRGRVRESGDVKDEGTVPLNTFVNSVRVRRSRDGESGIKGVRPPVLAPPAISLPVVDNGNSNWELQPSYCPQNGGPANYVDVVEESEDVDGGNVGRRGPANYVDVVEESEDVDGGNYVDVVEESEDVDGGNVGRREPNEERLSNTGVLSESCSDSSNDDKDDGPCNSSTTEHEYSISPNGRFNRNIMSWQKGDFLGSGSFGTVYEGFTEDGFFFAVKEVSLLDQGSQGKQSIYQLEQEISLLSQFKHENIVQYLGTNTDDGKLYIFLELVTKGSLANLYQKYNLQDSQVSAYTRQILSGLSYLHGRNVVHRDIKCANILVDVCGSVKLADFGLAKATKLNDVKSCKGTAFWMAPEVVNRKSRGYGLAADIWSLGCTVLEMLTRQVPYSHLEGMQALFRIGRGEPPPIPNSLSKDAQDFILKCLQVNPDNRPTAVELLDHPFVRRPLTTFSSPRHSGSR